LSIAGILKIPPADQQLFKDNQVMDDEKALQDYGLTSNSAKAQCPGSIGLAVR
jgi:transcription elongation factor B subunit 2